MIFSTLCPKCRGTIYVGKPRCANCGYRPTAGEADRALLFMLGWFVLGAFVIGGVIAFTVGH